MTQAILKPYIRFKKRSSIADEELLKNQDGRCFYCYRAMVKSNGIQSLRMQTKDHFFPRYHGFDLTGNKVFACAKCNNSDKGSRYPTLQEIYRFVKLHHSMSVKTRNKLIVVTKNDKPRFRMTITKELIDEWCR